MTSDKRKFDLQERLVDFAVLVIRIADGLRPTSAGRILSDQLLRAGTSPALHYGEAQAAESQRDFIHKMKVGLKELRECHACLMIIGKAGLDHDADRHARTCAECSELIAIFQSSVKTAKGKSRT